MDDVANREMLEAAGFMVLMIGAAAWQVMRTVSRGGLDGMGLIKLTCSLIVFGIMVYVGCTALSMWT
jgi:hypothetical protein